MGTCGRGKCFELTDLWLRHSELLRGQCVFLDCELQSDNHFLETVWSRDGLESRLLQHIAALFLQRLCIAVAVHHYPGWAQFAVGCVPLPGLGPIRCGCAPLPGLGPIRCGLCTITRAGPNSLWAVYHYPGWAQFAVAVHHYPGWALISKSVYSSATCFIRI
jgi:hypothetical protein